MVYFDKPEPEGNERGRREKRRWIVPPALGDPVNEIAGIRLLDELPPGIAAALFQWLRDALLWAQCDPPGDRLDLFHSSESISTRPYWLDRTETPEALRHARAVFLQLSTAPEGVTSDSLGGACAALVEWANKGGFPATELAFATAAALANPTNPDLAFLAGRAARRNAKFEHAQEWFRRSVALARRAANPSAYSAAYLGWGVLEQLRGNPERARFAFIRAWRSAKAGKLTQLAAAARHYMIPLAVGVSFEEGLRHAVAAYKLYGSDNPRLASLASDTGAFLSDHSHFSAAKPLFQAALPLIEAKPDRIVPLCNLARAEAALGNREKFEDLWQEVSRRGTEFGRSLPDALIELAEGARTLRRFRHAETTLDEAIEEATSRREPAALHRAQSLLAVLHEKPPDRDSPAPEEVRRFVKRFIRRLRAQAAPGK